MPRRHVLAAAWVGLTVLALTALPADAHVSILDPGEKGGFSIVTFSVPTERDDAGTVKVEVQLPQDHPLPFVSIQPKPGWTTQTTKRTLDTPIEAFGDEVTEVVDTVTWSGGTVAPGEFDTFSLSVGPLPADVDHLEFPTIQTYSSGEEVAWIQTTPDGGEEPENPAPVLTLVAGEGSGSDDAHSEVAAPNGGTTSGSEDDGTDGIAVAALVVAILAALLGAAALVLSRRRPA